MEIIIAVAIIGVGLIWYFNNKSEEKRINDEKNAEAAPYKVEAPEAKVEAVNAQPVEAKPAKAKKAPAKKPATAKKAPAKPKAKKATK